MSKEEVMRNIKKDIKQINIELIKILTTIPRQLEDLQIKLTQVINTDENEENYAHNLTFHALSEIMDRINSETENLSKVIKIGKDAPKELVICATDGSHIELNRFPISIASAYFSFTSTLNNTSIVKGDGTSLIPELHAIRMALKTMNSVKLKNVAIVVDNAVAIEEVYQTINKEVSQSNQLQTILNRSKLHKNILDEIKSEAYELSTLVLIWQKSHKTVTDLYQELNAGADRLCRELLGEVVAAGGPVLFGAVSSGRMQEED